MAHEIEGNYAFFGSNTPAWHGLGTVLKDAPTIEQAWKLAYPHHLFEFPLYLHPDQRGADGELIQIPNRKGIFRDDGKFIADVGAGFQVVQPFNMFNSFNPLIESGLVELEAGGSLQDGTRMWALGKIKNTETEIVKGDTIKGYLLMAGAFDGTMKHLIKNCATRVVCANTLAMAQDESSDLCFSFKHTASIHDRIKSSVEIVKGALEQFNQSVEAYRFLATKKVTEQVMKTYVKNVFATDDKVDDKGNVTTRTQNTIDVIIGRLDTQRGMELVPAARGTMWQAYNAVSEYVTHTYGRNSDSRLNGQWFGESAKLNSKALEMALTQ